MPILPSSKNRSSHARWQGKVYTVNGESEIELDGEKVFAPNLEQVTGYPSDPTGLCGYNCRHNLTPFKEGMRNPFKQYDSEENQKAYDLTQRLRAYERNIRKAKTEVKALSEAIENCTDSELLKSLNDKLDSAKNRLDTLNKAYKDFCAENDLRTFYERLYVARTPRTLEQLENKYYYNNSANAVANSAESGIIESENKFNTKNDPMVEAIGSAEQSHPEEIKQLERHSKEIGVELVRPNHEKLDYEPGLRPGQPGVVNISKGASYSAWLHEVKHADDDMKDGWLGMRVFQDNEKCAQREIEAYQIEIDMALAIGRDDIAQRLEVLRDDEIKKYRY